MEETPPLNKLVRGSGRSCPQRAERIVPQRLHTPATTERRQGPETFFPTQAGTHPLWWSRAAPPTGELRGLFPDRLPATAASRWRGLPASAEKRAMRPVPRGGTLWLDGLLSRGGREISASPSRAFAECGSRACARSARKKRGGPVRAFRVNARPRTRSRFSLRPSALDCRHRVPDSARRRTTLVSFYKRARPIRANWKVVGARTFSSANHCGPRATTASPPARGDASDVSRRLVTQTHRPTAPPSSQHGPTRGTGRPRAIHPTGELLPLPAAVSTSSGRPNPPR